MNTSLGIPLESFNLDEREFERCKVWSSIIKRYSTIEDDRVVDFDNLETEFCDENLGDDEIDDRADVSLDDDENENNPLNQSVMQLRSLRTTLINAQPRTASNGECVNFELIEPLAEADENDGDFDLQDILDQTIPILAERERKWKESGMLNILNTFDEEKIERTVGNWLRINSSIQAATTTHSTQVQSSDDDDSLHSMDTARYVRSNRKPRSSNCYSTIKSYRLLQSKRDALREKYAFSEDELERALRQHVNGARSRNNLKARNDCGAEHNLQRAGDSGLGMAKKRRKLLNKQRVRMCSSNRCFGSSSSSDENMEKDGEEQYFTSFLKRQRRRLPAACATSLRTPMGKGVLPLAHLRSVSVSAPRSSRFQLNQLQVLKPRKRASECCCFKEEKLCKFTDHLADISTEEWLVENCDSPKKVPKTKQNMTSEPKEVKMTKTTTQKKNRKAATQNQKVAEKTVADKKTKACTDISPLESSFERELQKAIELSKQTFEMKTMVIKGQCAKPKNKKIKNTKSKQPKSEVQMTKCNSDDHHIKSMSMHNVELAENKAADNPLVTSKKPTEVPGLETILTQSKQHRKSLKKQQPMEMHTQPIQAEKAQENKKETQEEAFDDKNKSLKQQSRVDFRQLPQFVDMSPSIIDDISPARLGLKPQPKSAKLKKMKRLNVKNQSVTVIKNDTFFSLADKICNSTAMGNDVIAMNKQFSTDSVKSSVTTTEATITATKTTNDLDCTIVSSTTDDLKQQKIANATYTTHNHANRDILLYTPHNRTLAPAHSYTDGVFNITEEHLSAVIGEKVARKFMKYYIGRRRFDANLTVYYRPPRRLWQNNSRADDDDETDSDVDPLEQMNHIGDLYVLFDK